MINTYSRITLGALLLWFSMTLHAQFVSGSNGSFGPIDVQSGLQTLSLPSDGIINATSVNVAAGATLAFDSNTANTPVYLLATGSITIDGTLSVDGEANSVRMGGSGGPGGFEGGHALLGLPIGDGLGPGAGSGNCGGANYGSGANAYGSALVMPPTGGSGSAGCNNDGGHGGGGGILMAATVSIHVDATGTVSAVQGGCDASGGAIRIVSPVVTGNGALDTNDCAASHEGRVRIDTIDGSGMNFVITGNWTVGSFMKSFPDIQPRLDITQVGSEIIPLGSGPASIELPFGSPSSQDVTVRGEDFTGLVPIRVVVTPNFGPSTSYDSTIDMTGGNPATVIVPVTIPQNNPVRLKAWTRDE